jgi:RNA polymerase sigma-70 factor (ECF subfamily)
MDICWKGIVMKTVSQDWSDADLLFGDKTGEEGFHELVERYNDSLYTFLRRFLNRHDLVEDAVQVTFTKVYAGRDKFDRRRPLKPWLFTIGANVAKDMLRRSRRHAVATIGGLGESDACSFGEILNILGATHNSPYEHLEQRETDESIRRVVLAMPVRLRDVLVLAYFQRCSYKQIATTLAIPIGTVKSRLHSAVACFARNWRAYLASQDELGEVLVARGEDSQIAVEPMMK